MNINKLISYLFEDMDEAALRGFSLDILKKRLREYDQGGASEIDLKNVIKQLTNDILRTRALTPERVIRIANEFEEWLSSKQDIKLINEKEIEEWLLTLPILREQIQEENRMLASWRESDLGEDFGVRERAKQLGSFMGRQLNRIIFAGHSDGAYIIKLLQEYKLPYLGQGSSRAVYALSTGKVLKVAQNDEGMELAGRMQNRAEANIWKNPATKYIGAQIYDIDPDNRWAIMEIAYIYKDPKQLKLDLGYPELIITAAPYYHIPLAVADFHKIYNENVSVDQLIKNRHSGPSEALVQAYHDFYENSPKGLLALVDLMYGEDVPLKERLEPGDIVTEHFGKTANGRPVLIDYGFTTGVAEKYRKR